MKDKVAEFKKWVAIFFASAMPPMDDNTVELFFSCSAMDEKGGLLEGALKELEKSFPYQVVDKRAAALGLPLSGPVKAFIAFICENPAQLVMYVMAIKGAYMNGRVRGEGTFTMGNIARLFPNGFPTRDSLRMAWEAQKGRGEQHDEPWDNLLDSVMGELVPKPKEG